MGGNSGRVSPFGSGLLRGTEEQGKALFLTAQGMRVTEPWGLPGGRKTG